MNSVHFTIGSPGYLCIQELYPDLETGGEQWGPLNTATFHSTTWILATVSATRRIHMFVARESNELSDLCLPVGGRSE